MAQTITYRFSLPVTCNLASIISRRKHCHDWRLFDGYAFKTVLKIFSQTILMFLTSRKWHFFWITSTFYSSGSPSYQVKLFEPLQHKHNITKYLPTAGLNIYETYWNAKAISFNRMRISRNWILQKILFHKHMKIVINAFI